MCSTPLWQRASASWRVRKSLFRGIAGGTMTPTPCPCSPLPAQVKLPSSPSSPAVRLFFFPAEPPFKSVFAYILMIFTSGCTAWLIFMLWEVTELVLEVVMAVLCWWGEIKSSPLPSSQIGTARVKDFHSVCRIAAGRVWRCSTPEKDIPGEGGSAKRIIFITD